ncbi:hypothetical protein [Stieleria marina]|uniref:HNH domain-containing protein n=1 Tax=Stieleria marina TaxID=1930275 RepID=A0A517NTM6_9BACT|nr:hypothetical protein K239x_24380 [Planctomycetes bacterium K23_9]
MGVVANQTTDPNRGRCTLCGRRPKRGTTEHHLIPRTCHKNKWFKKQFSREQMQQTISVCHDCHQAIHRFVPKEKTLGRDYHTVDQIMAHDQMATFVAWVSKQK